MLRWSALQAACVLTLLTSPPPGQGKAVVSFDSKKLESSSQLWWSHHEILSPRYENTPTNVTALVGDSAFLPCTVAHLGDRSVTWMRQRDLHILTAGVYTYSADERFRVLHPENSDDWTLHIKFATQRDAGIYECQVNSDPKISRRVTLTVRENQLDDPVSYGMATTDTRYPDYVSDNYEREEKKYGKAKKDKGAGARIEGGGERHIQEGSMLAITCVVHHPPNNAPRRVLWYHGSTSIDYNSPRGGVSIQTEKGTRKTVSKLMLSSVSHTDTGQYSCDPTDLPSAVLLVHVQSGNLADSTDLYHPSGDEPSPYHSIVKVNQLHLIEATLECVVLHLNEVVDATHHVPQLMKVLHNLGIDGLEFLNDYPASSLPFKIVNIASDICSSSDTDATLGSVKRSPHVAASYSQLQQPVMQDPSLSGASMTATVSSGLMVVLVMTLACVRCRYG